MLVVFGGLPGTGKTTIARELASQLGAVHLRIDTIEQALRNCGVLVGHSMEDAGYRVAYALAADNLCIGRTVIADSVNPLSVTRDAWLEVARRSGVKAVEIEVVCSDENEHRKRAETRKSDIPGLRLPTWQEVITREYHAWAREHIVIDTAHRSVKESTKSLQEAIAAQRE
jgi:predicted kinase